MSVTKKKLFLIDGTALVYRSHFAFANKPLTNSQGRNVGTLFAYTGTLFRILEQETPDLIAVAFDRPEPTFRHEKYEEYKATREKTPDELVEQLPEIKEITHEIGIPILEHAGWEADDLIGTLAIEGEKAGMDVFIVAGDKDFMQLVSDSVLIYNPKRSGGDVTIQDKDAVREKFGVDPGRVVDVLGLMGDSSDNVPGVPGIGLKTAVKLIREFGSIEGVYDNLDKVKGKSLKTKLEANKDMAFLSRELVVISPDAPVGVGLDDLQRSEPDSAALKSKFFDLEFNSFIKYLDAGKKDGAKEIERRYTLVEEWKTCEKLLERIKKKGVFVIDLETTSLDPRDAQIVGISVSVEEGEAFYIPADLGGRLFPSSRESMLDRFLKDLIRLLADGSNTVVGQNIKYDLAVLRRAGIANVEARLFDTMVAHYLLHPGEMQHGLDFLSLKYLDVTKIPTSDLIGKGKKQITMAEVPVERVSEYACEDADMTFRLKQIFEPELEEMGLDTLFHDLEMPLLLVLEAMEENGVRIDEGILKELSDEYRDRIEELTGEIHSLAGVEFNINSPKQLGPILFDKLEIQKKVGLKRIPKTKTGYSTNAAVLQSISAHPIGKLLLEYRRLQKLNSTYIEALPKLIHTTSGRIHTSFNQAVAATGRLSSSDPNLQNIPIRTNEGRRIREAFVPSRDGWLLLSADYSQVELRILAHISKDENLLKAFRKGEDIHKDTASLVFGIPPEEVTPEMRSQAKTINFGIIYGMGPQRLSRETGISFSEAKSFIEAYFDAFPGVRNYIDETLDSARETGIVTTLLGRKRRVENLLSSNQMVRSNSENIAVNTPIQGTAADLIKKAMVGVHASMTEKGLQSMMILQVHDELVFDVHKDELDIMKKLVTSKMGGALKLDLPLVVDIGTGENWRDAH